MKITVCELPNDFTVFEQTWEKLVAHVSSKKSEIVLLPEMPFSPWLAQSNKFDASRWADSVENHLNWINRLEELSPAVVISTRPVISGEIRNNVGYIWEQYMGVQDVHAKYYLPDETGFGKPHGIKGEMGISHLQTLQRARSVS